MSRTSRRKRKGASPDRPARNDDASYLKTLLSPLRSSAFYKPKFGRGNSRGGLDLDDFRTLYGADPFYAWFGLDNPLIYTAHRAAGGMTSIYRQIGIGCERLFRQMLQDQLRLNDEDTAWSHAVADPDGGSRTLSLDGRIPLESVVDGAGRHRVREWIDDAARHLQLDPGISTALRGAVFEVRQGYKSKDSKRQNADIANAAAAYSQAYLPVVVLLSTQIDPDVASRYEAAKWVLLRGQIGVASNLVSTYSFTRDVLEYDLAAFFERNKETLRSELTSVLETLLTTEQP